MPQKSRSATALGHHGALAGFAAITSFSASAATASIWDFFFPPSPTPTAPPPPYVSAARAVAEQALPGITSFGVADTASHLLSALPQLSRLSHLTSLKVTDTSQLHVSFATFSTYRSTLDKLVSGEALVLSGLSLAQGATAQSDAVVGSFTVTETTANVLAGLDWLNSFSHLAAVNLADGGPLALGYGKYLADAWAVSKLPAHSLVLSAVTAAGANAVAQDGHVARFSVSDTLANVGLNLDALAAAAKAGLLGAIQLTDGGGTLALSPGRYAADQDALALLGGDVHLTQTAAAFTINLVYRASMANAPAGMKAALAEAAHTFEGLFSSAGSVTIQVGYGEVNGQALGRGVLGAADPTGVTVTYTAFKAALAAHATSVEQLTALAHMGEDPTHGGGIFVPTAEAKVLGLLPAYQAGIDAVMGFATDPRGTLWNFDTAHRGVAGKYDFLGVAEHELAHALGRVTYLGADGLYTPLDLTRYSAPGVHEISGDAPAYFSLDGGVTRLLPFATSSDLADWASGNPPDAANAFLVSGLEHPFSHTDVVLMNLLGYALA